MISSFYVLIISAFEKKSVFLGAILENIKGSTTAPKFVFDRILVVEL